MWGKDSYIFTLIVDRVLQINAIRNTVKFNKTLLRTIYILKESIVFFNRFSHVLISYLSAASIWIKYIHLWLKSADHLFHARNVFVCFSTGLVLLMYLIHIGLSAHSQKSKHISVFRMGSWTQWVQKYMLIDYEKRLLQGRQLKNVFYLFSVFQWSNTGHKALAL